MVARRKDESGRGRKQQRAAGAWQELAPAAGLLGTVLAILVITAVLQGDRDDPALLPAGTAPEIEAPEPAPRAETAPREESMPVVTTTAPRTLEARSERDYERMFRNPGRWTLQLMVGCDPENVRKHMARFSHESALYILPMDHKGQSCYRICWGVYDSRDAAATARDIPGDLRAEIGHPEPKEIAAVTP